MRNDLFFQGDSLLIRYSFPRQNHFSEIEAFFEWLGDFDIVTAHEIKDDFVCAAGILYRFSDMDLLHLINNGKIILQCVGPLKDYINMERDCERDFYLWYNHLD